MDDQPHPTAGRARRRGDRATAARCLHVVVALAVLDMFLAVPASAATRPVVSGLSKHHDPYWGGTRITVHGSNLSDVRKVYFGRTAGLHVEVLSSSRLTVVEPAHAYGTVHVRVTTASRKSAATSADRFTFTPPSVNSPIQGGLTLHQEQRISARVRARHHGVAIAPRARHWTAAMGFTAMRRARSWLGLPYSWAGGTYRGPSLGTCASAGGDFDCHVVGFDCSGLALYAWGPYEHLVHYAATQHGRAGRFHPTLNQLVPGDLLFFADWEGGPIGHVVIYAGRGMVIQAPQSGYLVERLRLSDFMTPDRPYRGATRPMSTGAQGSGPAVSAITGQLPVAGGRLRISGRHLGTATSVAVGRTRVFAFSRRSAHALVVKVPPRHAGTAKVTISNPWGSVTRWVEFVAPPKLAALSVAEGPATGGNLVKVTGRNLADLTRVTVGSTPVQFTEVSARRLVVTMPAHAAATVRIVATSPFGTSNELTYTYLAAPSTPPPTSSSPPTSSPPASSPPPVPRAGRSAPPPSAAPPAPSATTGATPSAVPSR